MARIIAIDYGLKRTGLAVTDPMQIIATALDTVPTADIFTYLKTYFAREEVESIVVGMPTNLQGNPTDSTAAVEQFAKSIQKKYPHIPFHFHDERFTSKMALDALITGGTSKKYRREKGNIDKVSAVLILQSFIESQAQQGLR